MTVSDMTEANKQMAELFRQAWEVDAGYVCEWPNQKESEHQESSTWARWNLDYALGGQGTFGKSGERKFYKEGHIFITIYTPLGAGHATSSDAAQIAISAYEGKRTPGDVWFRDVRIESEGHGRGSGRNKSWWTTLVVARFTYDYLR